MLGVGKTSWTIVLHNSISVAFVNRFNGPLYIYAYGFTRAPNNCRVVKLAYVARNAFMKALSQVVQFANDFETQCNPETMNSMSGIMFRM